MGDTSTVGGADVSITPEPSEAEREAVLQALADEVTPRVPDAYRSPWRLSGLADSDDSLQVAG